MKKNEMARNHIRILDGAARRCPTPAGSLLQCIGTLQNQVIYIATLAGRDSPTRPGRSIKMGLYLYINLKFNGPNTLFLSWGDRAAARFGPQDGPPVYSYMIAKIINHRYSDTCYVNDSTKFRNCKSIALNKM
jgi:hypothetical protein